MSVNRARKLALFFYTAAVVLLIVNLLFTFAASIEQALQVGMFVCVGVGFLICYSFCRCPRCGHVIKISFHVIPKCPFCEARIPEE